MAELLSIGLGALGMLLIIAVGFVLVRYSDKAKNLYERLKVRINYREEEEDCPRCGGKGSITASSLSDQDRGFPCSECGGAGKRTIYVHRRKELDLVEQDQEHRRIRRIMQDGRA